jgi:hypothetical protein
MDRRVLFALPAFLTLYLAYSLQRQSLFSDFRDTISHYAKQHLQLNIQHPFLEHSPLPFTRRIVAVGDLHGDLPNARKVLQMTNVVDENGDWTGNVDYFVQTGDIIDR